MTTQTSQDDTLVSEETLALVEQKMASEPEEIKQKVGELVDLIKNRAEAELSSTEQMTRESYHKAISQARDTLKTTEAFFQEQEDALNKVLKDLNNEASNWWDSFVTDVKGMGNRIENAVSAAWSALKEDPK